MDGFQVFQDKLDTRELQELFEAVEVNVVDAQSLFKWGDLETVQGEEDDFTPTFPDICAMFTCSFACSKAFFGML